MDKKEFAAQYLCDKTKMCYDISPCGPDCPFWDDYGSVDDYCDYEKNLIEGEIGNFNIGEEDTGEIWIRAEVIDGNKYSVTLKDIATGTEHDIGIWSAI